MDQVRNPRDPTGPSKPEVKDVLGKVSDSERLFGVSLRDLGHPSNSEDSHRGGPLDTRPGGYGRRARGGCGAGGYGSSCT